MKELYLCGKEELIDKVLKFCKDQDLLDRDKIHLIDLSPDLTEEYKK